VREDLINFLNVRICLCNRIIRFSETRNVIGILTKKIDKEEK